MSKNEQIKSLKKEVQKLKSENQKLKDIIEQSKMSDRDLMIVKRRKDEKDWQLLLKRNKYECETNNGKRIIKNTLNILACIGRFFLLRRKDVIGTHLSFTNKKIKVATIHDIISLGLFFLAGYILFPNIFHILNEFLKQAHIIVNILWQVLKFGFVFLVAFYAKIHWLIGGEIDKSYDEQYVDSMSINIKDLIKKN